MQIDDGIVKGVRWVKAHASGGAMSPRYLVVHDTAGRATQFSSVEWFASAECTTSAHFVVERDGTITQMVPTNRKAFHAGVSKWKGISGLNSCSVGIEIVNPGKMDKDGKAWFGKAAEIGDIVKETTPSHGSGYWLPYTEEQMESVKTICRAVVEEYPDCNEIVTHWQISPGRKIDTNPLFPLEALRKSIFDPTPGEVEAIPPPVVVAPPPPPPTVIKEAIKSPSARTLGMVILGYVADFFFGLGAWFADRFGAIVEIIKAVQSESDDVIAPMVSLGEKLHLNLGKIALWATIATLVVVLIRGVNTKVELAKTKAKLPQADAEQAKP